MRPFRLLDLPVLQLKRVIFLMDNCQRIKLALCSDGAEEVITRMNIRTHSFVVHLVEETYLDIRSTFAPLNNLRIYFHRISEPVKRECGPEKIDKRVLSSCYLAGNDKEMHFELAGMSVKFDTVDLVKWMADMFPRAKIGWTVSLRTFGSDVLERLFQVPYFNRAYFLKPMKGELTSALFTEFTEKMKCLEHIYIYSTVPQNFNNMKALSYNLVHFEDARWLKVEHLMLIKSQFYLTVGQTMIDNWDLNRYLKYWKSTNDNVKGRVDLYLKSGVEIDRATIGQDLSPFEMTNSLTIVCDHDLDRDHSLAIVMFDEDSKLITFWTLEKEKDLLRYRRLVAMRKVDDLLKRIVSVDSEMKKCPRCISTEHYLELEDTRNDLEEQLAVADDEREVAAAVHLDSLLNKK